MKFEVTQVFYVTGARSIIDAVGPDGRGLYSHDTAEAIQARAPGAQVVDIGEAARQIDNVFRKPPQQITRERWWQMLEMLFPDDWHHGFGSESFKLSERLAGNVAQIFCRIGSTEDTSSYWEMADLVTLRHADIVALVQAAIKAKQLGG